MDPTVLIVDDDRQVADLYERWVDGYETLVAYDGERALELLETEAVDVVFLDRRMPGMSGDEVLERLRARDHGAWVTMVTAVDPAVDLLELPVNNYVVKPVERAQFKRLVETIRIRSALDDRREYVSLTNRIESLERWGDPADLDEEEAYRTAVERLRTMADRIAAADGDPATAPPEGEPANADDPSGDDADA